VRIIGVLDLLGGHAVHARRGVRAQYAPVTRVAGEPLQAGDGRALARAYVERLGIEELYIADLDAIAGREWHAELIEDIGALGVPVWLDAGLQTVADARRARDLGAAHLVVALETLPSLDALATISTAVGGSRVAFSLDLRDGIPVAGPDGPLAADTPEAIAVRAVEAGAGAIVLIDLARVGSGRGVDLVLVSRVRTTTAGARLVAGGGVRDWNDVVSLADAGCDAALVATSLHDGRFGAAQVTGARSLP
jgi:phosphoribosylformimino-5-aminoimidazole carboxamide ribotide isomerase